MNETKHVPLDDDEPIQSSNSTEHNTDDSPSIKRPETVPWSSLICYIIPMSLLMMIYAIVDSALMLLIPLHTKTEFLAGLIVTFVGISTVFASPIIGNMITRTSTEFVVLITAFLRTLCLLVIFIDSQSTALWLMVGLFYGLSIVGTQIPVNHYLSKHFPSGNRGRSASMINGVRRFGSCIGPLFAGHIDDFHVSILITMAISIQSVTVVCCLLSPPNTSREGIESIESNSKYLGEADGSFQYYKHSMRSTFVSRTNPINWIRNKHLNEREHSERRLGIAYVWSKYLKLLLMISVLSFGLKWVRITRKLILTFQGKEIGLSNGNIGSVNGISFVPDTLMFPVAGYLMDKYGRKATAIPGLVLFIVALSTVSMTTDFGGLMAVGIVFGLADGITAGLLMTIAADIAPSECKSDFLAGFRLFGNMPQVVGPVVIGSLCTHVSLVSAAIGSAGIGAISLFWTIFVLDDPKHHEHREEMMKKEMMLNDLENRKDVESIDHGITLELPNSLDAAVENDTYESEAIGRDEI